MTDHREPLVDIVFAGEAIAWRGPAPFVFVAVPGEHAGEIRHAAREASYGWGCVPIEGRIGETAFTTSLFPRGDTYMVPLKTALRKDAGIELGDTVEVGLCIYLPD